MQSKNKFGKKPLKDLLILIGITLLNFYNKARNFLTKKEFSQDKFKLNFENPTLADGWDRNKEVENTCVLLMKDDKYFLGIMNKKHNKIFNITVESLEESIRK